MRMVFLLVLGLLVTGTSPAWAQDAHPRPEPVVPPTCATLAAPLRIGTDGPMSGGTADKENRESRAETVQLRQALQNCRVGQAVELTLGTSSHSAFLINPVTLPKGVSLIVDGGVTVYASRNPENFQIPANYPQYVCGQVGENYPVTGGCRSLLTLSSESGIYGYGVLDGQGQRAMIGGKNSGQAWWDLLVEKKKGCGSTETASKNGCEQASPPMISAGFLDNEKTGKELTGKDLTLANITIRNPQFHTVRLAGRGITVWRVKVQAPWNVPNSDGFDVQGTDILLQDDTVANGDQDVAILSSSKRVTNHVTIDGLTAYGKGGVALLDAGIGITNLVVHDMAMTGDVASFVTQGSGSKAKVLINGVDVQNVTLPDPTEHLKNYGQALPTATHDLQGLQINWNTNDKRMTQVPGPFFSGVTFDSVCLQDVVNPIHLGPVQPYTANQKHDNMPTVENVVFRDVHVLAPTEQFPAMKKGAVSPGSGTYFSTFWGRPVLDYFIPYVLNNVVFDDLAPGKTSLADLDAIGNVISTLNNVYPAGLNGLTDHIGTPAKWIFYKNIYNRRTQVSDPSLAISCPLARWSFLTGELYLSLGSARATGDKTNLRNAVVTAGSTVALSAVLQPAMSQTTWFVPKSYGAKPGLLAVGSPALTNPVLFYENGSIVGTAQLSANGTLASALIRHIASGTHTYTAQYPGDTYYKPFAFGTVRVRAK